MNVAVTISSRDDDAALFDLDGVLTTTASVHAAAWKKLFDGILERWLSRLGADARGRSGPVQHGMFIQI